MQPPGPDRGAIVRRTDFSGFHCSLARTLEVVGDWWTPLVIRDVYLGVRRFDELVKDLGIPRNILAERLAWLTRQGVVEKRAADAGRGGHEYVLTVSGRELVAGLLLLTAWGDRWRTGAGDGPPMLVLHTTCGQVFTPGLRCSRCGQSVELDDVSVAAGPGGHVATGTTVIGRLLAGGVRMPMDAADARPQTPADDEVGESKAARRLAAKRSTGAQPT